MTIRNDVENEVDDILNKNWSERDGRVIPDVSEVALANGAVKMEATFLYADLAGSSKLAQLCPWGTTAKIIRAYLSAATRLIRHNGGVITSFDGDRVMGVFIGDNKNTSAVKTARQIDWSVTNVLNPKAKEHFESIVNNQISIRHCVGVDTGVVRAVRAGIRSNNDLIWIGRAPSLAAKLSDIRNYPNEVFVSYEVYNSMHSSQKTLGDGTNPWFEHKINFAGKEITVVKTKTPIAPE